MFAYLRGRLVERHPTSCVIDVGGVGYQVDISLSTYEALPREGDVKLLTWLRVAEDEHRLYGFATERERELFLRLISVSQLGPSKAIQILSGLPPAELARVISEGDAAALKRVKGVGEKLANRLIVELRGKLPEEAEGKAAGGASISDDAVRALLALQVERPQAEEAVRRARKELGADADLAELIRRSLAHV